MIRTATASLPIHCAPIDKNAIRELWAAESRPIASFDMPELCQISIEEIRHRHSIGKYKSNFRDLTGQRRGTLVVIGLIAYHENGKSVWCVKCDCGRYEVRSHYRWGRDFRKNIPDWCTYCSPMTLEQQVMRRSNISNGDCT